MQAATFPTSSVSDAAARLPSPPDKFLPARQVWERYGVTSMTLHRWLADERMGFPQPTYLGRFRYWKLAELEAWERRQAGNREAA